MINLEEFKKSLNGTPEKPLQYLFGDNHLDNSSGMAVSYQRCLEIVELIKQVLQSQSKS